MTTKKSNNKTKIIVVAVIVLAALIGYGAYQGRNQEARPTDSLTDSSTFTAPASNQANTNTSQAPAVAANTATPEAGKDLRVVKTWSRKDCSLAPWLITDKLGYFAEEGIKLVFTGELQPPQQIPSIIKGDNDVSSSHPNSLAVAINGGAPLRGVVRADLEPADDLDPAFRHMWWFINPEKYPNVKSFADLKDVPGTLKFSIISINQCSDFLANRILERYGIPLDKIEWVTMPDVQAIQALAQGLTDVGGVHPPFYKGMLETGNLKIADSSDAQLEPEVAGLGFYFFTEKFIADNPETVKGFVRAISRGQRWINENPEQARLWTEEAIGVPVSANHYYADNLKIVDSQIEPWIFALEKNGVIPNNKIKPQDLVVHDFEQFSEGLGQAENDTKTDKHAAGTSEANHVAHNQDSQSNVNGS